LFVYLQEYANGYLQKDFREHQIDWEAYGPNSQPNSPKPKTKKKKKAEFFENPTSIFLLNL
jgi:hypothetical protein